MKTWISLFVAGGVIFFHTATALADYTLVLKNGRQITVQSYREENGMIKFYGFGGEIGISKVQLQSIRQGAGEESSGLNLLRHEAISPSAEERAAPSPTSGPQAVQERSLSPEERRDREEKEYQKKVNAITERAKELRDRYAEATRGTTSSEPSLITSQEGINAIQEDVSSRRLDSQYNPVDPGVLRLLTPSPFSSLPPSTTEQRAPAQVGPAKDAQLPGYTDKQKELSDVRNQAIQLEQERERLINEMRQKNYNPGLPALE